MGENVIEFHKEVIMPFDAINLSVLTEELKQKLIGGKINKISQPEKDEVVLNVFNKKNYKLSVSASGSLPKIHLTEQNKPNPAVAPSFCMVLRKHILNGEITNVFQQPFERVVVLEILSGNELGDSEHKKLICEVVGKSANIFLTKGDYTIIDCLKRIPLSSLADRPTVPGQKFEFLTQDKIFPDDFEKIKAVLDVNQNADPNEILKNKLLGVAYPTLVEMTAKGISAEEVTNNIKDFLIKLKNPCPQLITDENGKPKDVTAIPYVYLSGQKKNFDSLNEAYDSYYGEKDAFQRKNERTKSLATVVKHALNRIEKKTALQLDTLLEAKNNEQNKIFGEIILSNLYKMKKGDESLTAINYYDNSEVTIKLDPLLTPQQNSQKYFKKYAKQKKTVEYTKQLLEENKKQIEYLKSIMQSLNSPLDVHDIEDITVELQNAKLIKKPQLKGKQKPKPSQSKPMQYEIDDWTVLVGKNNTQNDKLTFGTAKPNDIWVHTQNFTSCHTIILNPENKQVPDKVIEQAAEITAFFSEAANSSKVSVFYTEKKNVKKPPKSPLGFVNILSFKTCVVDPHEHADKRK